MSNAYQQLLATLGDVLKTLGTQPLSDEHVHAARKSIKKARAGLRLLRERPSAGTATKGRTRRCAMRGIVLRRYVMQRLCEKRFLPFVSSIPRDCGALTSPRCRDADLSR